MERMSYNLTGMISSLSSGQLIRLGLSLLYPKGYLETGDFYSDILKITAFRPGSPPFGNFLN